MSHSEHSGTDADETSSLYAPLLTEIQTAFGSLITNHNQIVASQATRTQQSLRNVETWHAQHKRMLGQYLANSNRFSYLGGLDIMAMDASLDGLGARLQLADEQLLKREMGMAQRQTEACGRLMETVSKMIEKLRADEGQYREEMKEQRRKEEALAWRIQLEEKAKFVRAWVDSSAVVEPGEGSTDEELAFWE